MISINNRTCALLGIGSYVASAVEQGQLGRVGLAILTMALMVVDANFLFRRPLVA